MDTTRHRGRVRSARKHDRLYPAQSAVAQRVEAPSTPAHVPHTNAPDFAYRIAVTRLRGDTDAWGKDPTISANLSGCSVGFLPLEEMWATMLDELTTTPAPSEIGRLAQLLKAAGLTAARAVVEPSGTARGSETAALEEAENGE